MMFHAHDDPFSTPVVFPVGNPFNLFKDDVILIITDSLGDFWEYSIQIQVKSIVATVRHFNNCDSFLSRL